jgi:hypothetical protein
VGGGCIQMDIKGIRKERKEREERNDGREIGGGCRK